ncbi:MAG: peptide chain release factor N(5)-glutamine methyltransferase [Pseudomonadota bacterium]
MNIAQCLAAAAVQGIARMDAHLLLLHALGRASHERAWLLAHDTDPLGEAQAAAFDAFCRRRAAGEPVAYILGRKEFFGLDFSVDARVLVPRPETEALVEWALELLPVDQPARVVDLGTGSGAIALAIKQARLHATVEAVDRSAAALTVARTNAQALGLELSLREASWLDGAQGRYDLIVSNPPYVREDDPHLDALAHEPRSALAAGSDGLRDLRSIVAQAPAFLASGAWLLLEHGYDQAADVRALLEAAGFQCVASRRDLAGIERCSGGKWLELG